MLLSVIVPVHNSSQYLNACVSSIISQGLKPDEYEIILVNNASTDTSLELCNLLKKQYYNLNIVVLSTNIAGVGNARNMGLEQAGGEYIHFVDADDYLGENMYKDIKKIIDENNCDIVITGIINDLIQEKRIYIESSEENKNCKCRSDIIKFIDTIDEQKKVWVLNVIWNKWLRRSIILNNNIRFRTDVNLGEDFIFCCTYMLYIENMYITKAAYYHYIKRGTITLVNRFQDDVLFRRPLMYKTFCDFYNSYKLLDKHQQRVDLLEGKLLFGSLYTVFNTDCTLNSEEKMNFIKTICNSAHFKLSIKYLKHTGMNYHKLIISAIEKENYKRLMFFLKLRVWMKKLKT